MAIRKIKVLHFVVDDKFIDGEMDAFDGDGRFFNEYVLVVDSKDYQISKINKSEKIKLIYSYRKAREILKQGDYDVVFFVSLLNYHIINSVPDNKIVIWWAFGYDIYGPNRFIDIPLFKPLTNHYVNSFSLTTRIKSFLKKSPFLLNIIQGNKDIAIRKIHYFQPPIPFEYKLMQKYDGFTAKQFYYPKSHYYSYLNGELPCHNHDIIVGNSATETNNHLDVWARIQPFVPNSSRVIFPINYGHLKYADYLEKTIGGKTPNAVFLKNFLPKEEYLNLIGSSGYAVYGVLREQAMGGINRCLANGVKLFLYRDSIPFKYLKELGCVVFAIEDIDDSSFNTPLSIEQAQINRRCLNKDSDYVNKITEDSIAEIQRLLE